MSYQLDKIDRKLLFELDKNCRTSDHQLAKMVNRSREAVRYRIRKLENDGVIQGFITSINPSKFGFMLFKLYFQLANLPKERERFFDYLKKMPGMYWFGGNDGVWEPHATFFARDVHQAYEFKHRIFSQFQHLILKRDTGVLINVRQFPKRYLLEGKADPCQPVLFADTVADNPLDHLDRKILTVLLQDARIPYTDLAKRCSSTIDIVRRRMHQMEASGIIFQYRIAVDHAKLGFEMFKAFIYFNSITPKDELQIFEFAKNHNQVLYVIRQYSAWDIELEVMAKGYEDFAKLMDEFRLVFAKIMRNYEFCFMRDDIWIVGEKDLFPEETKRK